MTDCVSSTSVNIPETGKPRVVIIGGGFGGLAAINNLRGKGFQVVVFDKQNYNTFHPLLYQVATAGLQPDAIASPLRKEMWEAEDFHYRMLEVTRIDAQSMQIVTPVGTVFFDYLIIATGSKTNYFGNSGMEKYALPLKTIPDALNVRSQLIQTLEQASLTVDKEEQKKLLTIVIIGGGPTGVEMAGAIAELRKHVLTKDFPTLNMADMNIYLLEGGECLLPAMSPTAGVVAGNDLLSMGVKVLTNAKAQHYDGKTLILSNGETIDSSTVIWSAGVKGNMPEGMPAACVEKGKLVVNEYCMVRGFTNIFAIGDIASFKTSKYPAGLPGVAQPAMQMGAYLGMAIQQIHGGLRPKVFKYLDKGAMATIGRKKAVAEFPVGLKLKGRMAWLMWLLIHISYLVGFRNKLVVLANWCWSFLTYEKGNRLIIRPFVQKTAEIDQHSRRCLHSTSLDIHGL